MSLAPLSWGTTTTRRVTRSTLAAETYAASEGAETAECMRAVWLRAVWLEVLQGAIPSDIVPSTAGSQSTRIHVLTDSASLASTMNSKRQDLASHDKRARTFSKCWRTLGSKWTCSGSQHMHSLPIRLRRL
eukprot:4193137-Amphidinium_carterae.2